MAFDAYTLIFDCDNRKFLSGLGGKTRGGTLNQALGPLSGQNQSVRLLFAQQNPTNGKYIPVKLSSELAISLRFARIDRKAVFGKFTLTWQGETTTELQIGCTMLDIQCALNNLDAIESAGGVRVERCGDWHKQNTCCKCRSARECKHMAGSFQIRFNLPGARADFTLNCAGLLPKAYPLIGVVCQGDATTEQVFSVDFPERRIAGIVGSDWSDIPDGKIIIDELVAGNASTYEEQYLHFNIEPVGGSFSLQLAGTTTDAISVFASASDIETAINSALGCTVAVQKCGAYAWRIKFREFGAKERLTGVFDCVDYPQGVQGTFCWDKELLCYLFSCASCFEADGTLVIYDLTNNRTIISHNEPVTFKRPTI